MSFLGAAPDETIDCLRCYGTGRHQGGVCFRCKGARREKVVRKRPTPKGQEEKKAALAEKRRMAAQQQVLERGLRRAKAIVEEGRVEKSALKNLVAETIGLDPSARQEIERELGRFGQSYIDAMEFTEREGHFGF
jgi:hypothetical protein